PSLLATGGDSTCFISTVTYLSVKIVDYNIIILQYFLGISELDQQISKSHLYPLYIAYQCWSYVRAEAN
ncbi:MAG TPA: hypothetical protein VHF44_03260, partial [Nitrososphaeraceae archaeon]|nr:hypothetical protein [Nitrososphaeraceae archaeon]